jgi:hypothetical protein
MPVIIPQESGRGATVERPTTAYLSSAYTDAWRVLGWVGAAFFAMSAIDVLLGWYPVRFGSPEWEFGTISATVSALSIPTLGLYLVLGSAIARERPKVAKAAGIVMIAMGVFLLILAFFYLTTLPLALRAVRTNEMVSLNMKKAVLKWLILFAGYEALFVLGGLKGIRRRPSL